MIVKATNIAFSGLFARRFGYTVEVFNYKARSDVRNIRFGPRVYPTPILKGVRAGLGCD